MPKKIGNTSETKTSKKSALQDVPVKGKLSSNVDAVHATKSEIKELDSQVKKLKAQIAPQEEMLKEEAINYMVSKKSIDSIKFISEKGQALGFTLKDVYLKIQNEEETLEAMTSLVGEKVTDDFYEYKMTLNPEVFENEAAFKKVQKLHEEIQKEFGINLVINALVVKKGTIKKVTTLAKAKMKKVIDLLNPTISILLR